jgi:undecaprenyl-phosphate 4-deoxy-4-formamido-L-arabinose transferase
MNKLSVVVPVYNSENSLEMLVERLMDELLGHYPSLHIYLVDDASMDRSWMEIQRLCGNYSFVHGLRLKENRGQQNALLAGIQHTNCEFVVTVDDDLQHRAENIHLLMEKVDEGYDAVYGIARNITQRPSYRNLGAGLRDVFFHKVIGMPKNIEVSSFRVINQGMIETLKKINDGFVYLSVVILKNSKNIGNVFYDYVERPYGRSNYTLWKLTKLYFQIVIQYSDRKLLKRLKDMRVPYEIAEKCGMMDLEVME